LVTLEAFEAQGGTVLIRGFTQIGKLQGIYGGLITVQSQEFTNATTGQKEYGITIEVGEDRAFIDYEEIPSLTKGIDYISKVDKSSTKLDNYQADYRTKGDFRISKFSQGLRELGHVEGKTSGATVQDMFSVSSGRICSELIPSAALLDSIAILRLDYVRITGPPR
jgi:hypothetical protein